MTEAVASYDYMIGRKKYNRPQGLLLANNPGQIVENGGKSYYIPLGAEVDAFQYDGSGDEFLILSDDNRDVIGLKPTRIGTRQRTVNGRMRSYHITDKLTIEASWSMLPSRKYDMDPQFGITGLPTASGAYGYTSDGGAGGADILDWYERYTDSFWVYLAYDKYTNFKDEADPYANLPKYNEIVEVFFSDFSYSIQKRGGTNHDYWDVSFSLEEV